MKKNVIIVAVLSAIIVFASCCNDTEIIETENSKSLSLGIDQKTAMSRFAEIISVATYNRPEVREFLKREAIKQFDKNYDVLYVNVKDSYIGNETFGDILNYYATSGELESIENAVPTINIYIPKISLFDVLPENLDCKDKEIPVVLPGETDNKLYVNGVIVDSIAKGNVPDFHVFVINKNSRVVVDAKTRAVGKRFRFIDPEFDTSNLRAVTRGSLESVSVVGEKAIKAYSYFYKDDGSNQSKALQRDYIYYGMTPTSQKGNLNQSVSEYMSFIEIDPVAYFKISDNIPSENKKLQKDDPELKKKEVSRKKRDFTTEELINEFWTEGCYNLKIEVIRSTSNVPTVKYLALLPEDIWNFNLDRTYRHSTALRHSKYTYRIDPRKFTAKRYYLASNFISFGKWDLSNESLSRDIIFTETDPGDTYSDKYEYETQTVKRTKVNGDVKIGIGLNDGKSNITTDVGVENETTTTKKVTKVISVTRTNYDDPLGDVSIYFYDPIIEGKSGSQYQMKIYNTGNVLFGVTAK